MRKLLFLPMALFALASCETGDANPEPTSHIYAVGNNANNEAYLTKDGVHTSLGAGYFVLDLFVNGDDVYTSGDKDGLAAYTKNGVFHQIGAAGSGAHNIYVDGDDVYVSGKQGDSPAYWKNGVLHTLEIASGFKGVGYDITVSNGDVYVAGYECNFQYPGLITNMLYWKNDVLTRVNSTHTFSFNWIGEISIAVSNNDVYLAVNERDIDAPGLNGNVYLIRNGVEETLIDDNAEVHDIFISGSDIYLCGGNISSSGVPNKSVVWKNGAVLIEKDNEFGAFSSVVVVDNNVFAVGIESTQVAPEPLPFGTRENHGTTLINNVFEIAPDFGTAGYASGYMALVVTQ